MSNLDLTDSQTSLPRGSGKPQDGEPVAHPGRGGQNVYINDAPSPNHPRGSGTSQNVEPAQSTSDKQSANDVGLSPQQLTIVQDRINQVMQNQSAIEI